MRINTVSDNRIDIFLSDEEINDIFGGYELIDYDAPDCRTKIHNLLAAAIPDILLPLNCERVLIEVKPRKYGCVMTFTKVYDAVKKFKRIGNTKTVTLIFESSNSLIDALSALCSLSATASELYTYGGKYAVLATVRGENANALTRLGEYCEINLSEMSAAKVREYWQPVCKRGAITRLSSAFLN